MKKRFSALVFLSTVVFLAVSTTAIAAVSGATDAVITTIQGTARVYAKGSATGRLVRKGDAIKKDQEVRVEEKSRIEISFPDGTVMRLAEKSRLAMSDVRYDKETENKKVKVDLFVGKLWAKVKKLVTSDSSVEVKTVNAVAGVRGTVYRVNVDEDKSAMVKVYDGTVYVANPPRDASQPIDKVVSPHEVPGPHEVPPPYHEVSMEEWTAIVKAMQQITISPQGVPSKPEDFDPKADDDDWVKWNREKDKQLPF